MRYEQRDYFTEKADATVNGFTVIETDKSEGYRVAEKWQKSNEADKWVTYWIDADELQRRVSNGKCERAGQVSDEQFEAIVKKTDERVLQKA